MLLAYMKFFFSCLYRIYLAEILSHVGCCKYSYLYSPFFPKCNRRVLAIFSHEKSFWSTIWWLSPRHSSWICNFLIKWYAAGAKSSFWPCRYLVWAIWNSILEVLPRNIDWKGNHQNPHSGLQCSIFSHYLIMHVLLMRAHCIISNWWLLQVLSFSWFFVFSFLFGCQLTLVVLFIVADSFYHLSMQPSTPWLDRKWDDSIAQLCPWPCYSSAKTRCKTTNY